MIRFKSTLLWWLHQMSNTNKKSPIQHLLWRNSSSKANSKPSWVATPSKLKMKTGRHSNVSLSIWPWIGHRLSQLPATSWFARTRLSRRTRVSYWSACRRRATTITMFPFTPILPGITAWAHTATGPCRFGRTPSSRGSWTPCRHSEPLPLRWPPTTLPSRKWIDILSSLIDS